mmetsp:Transcript_83530/g.97667  ORF Transcript_83530/g.97667 Transcript_83530/m.97667 type:complete len:175 (+) Transcript_83530:39-563(+)|eukprot:CAMPEP_0176431960 /NCGR_PEP_ID=MMETSP0127-20121128/15108_1 /TAXON_ID=938130 /ORGANISM="Platyophrya macrostoma, Strain WH" /LENGTH=174 /DNA_ID=CAMNT_0017814037 /DNA_START=29 /DNA_END=553 /DNA_ORIENTATION=+
MTHNLTVPEDFGYVMLSLFGLLVVYFLTFGALINNKRKKTFTKEFMEKHFGDEHKKVFGTGAPNGGYPDMGNGRYAQKLSYEQWYDFNNAQRVHYNFLEQIPVVVIGGVLSGVFYPIPAAIAIGTYTVGRVIYAIGYIAKGPNFRGPGALLGAASMFFLLGSSGYAVTKYALKL